MKWVENKCWDPWSADLPARYIINVYSDFLCADLIFKQTHK